MLMQAVPESVHSQALATRSLSSVGNFSGVEGVSARGPKRAAGVVVSFLRLTTAMRPF